MLVCDDLLQPWLARRAVVREVITPTPTLLPALKQPLAFPVCAHGAGSAGIRVAMVDVRSKAVRAAILQLNNKDG